DHYAKFGSIAVDGTTTPPTVLTIPGVAGYNNFDNVLLNEQLIDKLFATKLGDGSSGSTAGTRIVLLTAPTAAGGTPTATTTTPGGSAGAYFDLSGSTSNTISGCVVAVALITGVTLDDARSLNKIIDGAASNMGESSAGVDLAGRVKYNIGANPTGT